MKRTVSNVKTEKLEQELKDLAARGDDELKDFWRSLFGTKPPHKIHRSLLIAAVAHRMQENTLGPLKSSVRRQLMQVANSLDPTRPSAHYASLRPRAGTLLVREWGGVTHQAKVLEDGILFAANDTSHFPRLRASSPARAGRDRCSSASKPAAKEQNSGTS